MGEQFKRYYPVFLDLEARLVVVIGGGAVAERKVRQLRSYGADVTVITSDPSQALLAAEAAGDLVVERRDYVRGDLHGAAMAVCVTPDEEIRRAVHSEAETEGCLLNVLDAPELCSFIVPAVVNRGPLQIAVSTGGLAPGLTKQVRRDIAAQYGPEWGEYALLMGDVRAIACELIADPEERATVLEAVASSDALERIQAGESPTAPDLIGPHMPTHPVASEEE